MSRLPFLARGLLLSAAFAATAAALGAQQVASAPAAANETPIRIVSTAWLAAHLADADVVVVQVEMSARYTDPRIPGARVLPYSAMTVSRAGITTELPTADSLVRVFASLGISDSTLVVVTSSHEAPMASRALMSLDYLGHERLAFLDGGVGRWRREGRATSTLAPSVQPGRLTARVRAALVVDAPWISERIASGALALIDTRTDGEYVGAGERNGMPSAGHLDGASQLEWQALFTEGDPMTLRDTTALRRLYGERMRAGDTLVTYCWIGYRASMTYVAARALGLPVRFYDGSYQDWQQRRLPVTAGAAKRKAASSR